MSKSRVTTPTDRATLLGRVRTALGRDRTTAPTEPPPVIEDAVVRLGDPASDRVEVFVKQAQLVGMMVQRLRADGLTKAVTAILTQANAKRVALAAGTLPQALALPDAIRRKGMQVVDWRATPDLDAQFDIDVGITDVHAALAETGSIICTSDGGHSRGLSLVPPVHIAIVRRSDILPDMIDYWQRQRDLTPTQMPSSIAIITGPSKTADIEGILITGVHGPGQVHVLVIEDA